MMKGCGPSGVTLAKETYFVESSETHYFACFTPDVNAKGPKGEPLVDVCICQNTSTACGSGVVDDDLVDDQLWRQLNPNWHGNDVGPLPGAITTDDLGRFFSTPV